MCARGLAAAAAALALTALLIVLCFRLVDLPACVAIGVDLLGVIAVVKLAMVTLTVATMAALVLALVAAGAANVLVVARVAEDIRAGQPAGVAVEAGFARTWPGMRHTAVAIMFACAVLAWAGRSPGALTDCATILFVGMAAAVATALWVTRPSLRLLAWLQGARRTAADGGVRRAGPPGCSPPHYTTPSALNEGNDSAHLAASVPHRETLVRGDDLAQRRLAAAVVGRRVQREAQ